MEILVSKLQTFVDGFCGSNVICLGTIGGLFIVVLNAIGALLVIVFAKPSERFLNTSLGFAAGIMLAASFTSLILPGIEVGGVLPVLVGIVLGAVFVDLLDHIIPHMHVIIGKEGLSTKRLKAVWLFIIAITIHNMPEGLAVGVGFGSGNLKEAVLLMLAIGIQNIPEGLAVAVSAINIGLGKRFYASWVGIRAGLVELPIAILGAWAVSTMEVLLPYAMGFAAGAMIYVISDEIIPETHRVGTERFSTFGLILGLIIMLYLDVSLG